MDDNTNHNATNGATAQENGSNSGTTLTSEQAEAIMGKMFVAAQHSSVFGEPVQSGEYTVITACEVGSGGGFGFGGGSGPAPQSDSSSFTSGTATGSGGGGGGGAMGRPVAMVVIGPDGVRVEPIVDVSRIAMSAIKMWGAVATILASAAKSRANKKR